MTIVTYPHHYAVTLEGDQLNAAPRVPIQVGAPPQFGGNARVWSPEELLVGAVLACVKATFAERARNSNLAIYGCSGSAVGVLDKSRTGAVFTSIRVELDVDAALGMEEWIRELLHRVARTCVIARAIGAPVEIVSRIRELARAS